MFFNDMDKETFIKFSAFNKDRRSSIPIFLCCLFYIDRHFSNPRYDCFDKVFKQTLQISYYTIIKATMITISIGILLELRSSNKNNKTLKKENNFGLVNLLVFHKFVPSFQNVLSPLRAQLVNII